MVEAWGSQSLQPLVPAGLGWEAWCFLRVEPLAHRGGPNPQDSCGQSAPGSLPGFGGAEFGHGLGPEVLCWL